MRRCLGCVQRCFKLVVCRLFVSNGIINIRRCRTRYHYSYRFARSSGGGSTKSDAVTFEEIVTITFGFGDNRYGYVGILVGNYQYPSQCSYKQSIFLSGSMIQLSSWNSSSSISHFVFSFCHLSLSFLPRLHGNRSQTNLQVLGLKKKRTSV